MHDAEAPKIPVTSQGRTDSAPGSGYRRFVVAALLSCLGVLAAIFALNATIDPFAIAGTGVVPTAIESDRSVKLTLIEQLSKGPEILILGSSRSRQAEPAFLHELTGNTGFNAGVTGGTAADAWAMTRFVADRFPHQKRRYLWFIDTGVATNGVNPQLRADPRARKYLLGGGTAGFGLADVSTYISTDATSASWRVFKKCVLKTCHPPINYLPDGSIARRSLKSLPEQAGSLGQSVAKVVASIQAHPPARNVHLNPKRFVYFERALAFMNEHGARPVLVLNPIHPKVLAELEKYGLGARRAELDYLGKLHRRFDFVVVDCHDIRTWGGSTKDFSNATHVNERNMRRMLRYVVAHSDGALS